MPSWTRPSRRPSPIRPTILRSCWRRSPGPGGARSPHELSPEHKEIIDLVYYHEKSVDECAQILGVPSGTVKTRMFYARKKLAEMVKGA